MKVLITALALSLGCASFAVAQESQPAGKEAAEPSPKQLEVLLKKLVGALRAKRTEVVSETLRSVIPSKEAVEAAMTKDGFSALGAKVQAFAKETFSSGPQTALEKLGVTEEFRRVEVFSATTEDLRSMETETIAAREFASALRRTADHLKAEQTFYCARLYPRDSEENPNAGVRLQLFYHHGDRFVFLGPIWKFEKQE